MSDTKPTPTTMVTPDAEMLKNLDLLLSYDVISDKDSDLQLLQDLSDLEQAPSKDEQGDSK